MNNRRGVFTFFLFLLLAVMVVLQFLSMIQADRLYKRLNQVVDRWSDAGFRTTKTASNGAPTKTVSVGQDEYPGDEGGWLVWGVGGEVRTLNLLSVNATLGTRDIVSGNIIETLFVQDLDSDKTKLKPKLAEYMDVSDDGLVITVGLKENIYFSDGVPITADDVIFTYKTIMNPGVDCADLRSYFDNLKDVVKLDDRTIQFVVKERYWKTIAMIGSSYVFPKHIYQFDDPVEFNNRISDPVGSGPYVFERWDVGQKIVLKRNENYWGKKPKIDKVVFRFITNATAQLQALLSHEIDVMEPGSEQVTDMPKNPEFAKDFRTVIFWDPTFGFWYIGWNQAQPFFQDRRVRLAMTHLIDRQTMVDHLTRGNGAVVTGPFYIYGRQSNPDIEPWPYDPERAKQLLDEAGWIDHDGDGVRDKNGVPFRFKHSYVSGNVSSEQVAKLFKDAASRVGVDVIADPLEGSVLMERINSSQFDSLELMWGGVIESDPYQIFHSSQIKGRGNNRIGFSHPDVDRLIEQARRELDDEKRYQLYHELHRLLHEQQPYTFMMTRPRYYFIDRRFENVIIHKLGIDPLEWYVPKEKQRYK